MDLLSDLVSRGSPQVSGQLLSNLPTRGSNASSSGATNSGTLNNGLPSSLTRQNSSNQAGVVISKIERIFESITDCILEEEKEMTIKLKFRNIPKENTENGVAVSLGSASKSNYRTLTFPNKNPQGAWRFTVLLRILELSHEALVTGTITTKRDIYYREPELFMKQAVVDRFVDDIAHTFGVPRAALNIVAAAKGLIVGSLVINRKDGTSLDCASQNEGLLITNPADIEDINLLDTRWILVIEKEATFHTLGTTQYWKDSLAGLGILITAKGYPDIQTRQFLRRLSDSNPSIPIYALVDFDPDGIGIMSTYKHGSMNLAHEADLAVSSIQWLGVRSCDFIHGNIDQQGLLTLTSWDRRIARKMLENKKVASTEVEWRRELQVMLMLNVKAEIQILGNGEKLGEWLDEKLMGLGRTEDVVIKD